MMPSAVPPERPFVRRVGLVIAFAIAVAFFVWSQAYFEPLHTGVDQNGYLVGGKQFARTLMPRQSPTVPGTDATPDPHAFVADMWVQAKNDKTAFDPKYPIGLPLVYAILIWLTGGGTTAAFYVSPIAMAFTLPATFVVVRRFAGTYGGLLATLALAVSPLTASLANNPNSHAITAAAVTWGMAAVLHWWHDGGRRWAVIGGLLVGYAATVRYTEGLLVLPLIWAVLFKPVGKSASRPVVEDASAETPSSRLADSPTRRFFTPRLLDAVALGLAWATPIALLVGYNLLLLGTLTGYDATNESTGFAWSFFFDNWATVVHQFGANGLLFLLPVAVAGLVWMPWRDWRHAGFLLAWAGPLTVLYAFYYWAPDGLGYMRFFTSTLTPLLAAAFWLMRHITQRGVTPLPDDAKLATPARRMLRYAMIAGVGVAVGTTLFYVVRYDEKAKTISPIKAYLDRPATAYARFGGTTAFYGGIVAAAAFAAALAATTRRSAGTLAGGAIALLSIAPSAVESRTTFEFLALSTRMTQATTDAVRQIVPDGAMLVCREPTILQPLQFTTNNLLYTGLSFDRNWVNGRPQASVDDPVLIDPVRGQQLIDALKDYKTQDALTDRARVAVRAALSAKRRVFVLEPTTLDPMRVAVREKKDGPVPEFVRRYINPAKDSKLIGRRLTWWYVPQVVADAPATPRGRRIARPEVRPRCYQLWEIKAG